MTSIVVCKAHPAEGKELVVKVFEPVSGEGFEDVKIINEVVLQKGEIYEAVVYDNRRVTSFERDVQKGNEDA